MIVYDNQAQFRILFKRIGSVVPSTLTVGFFCFAYGATLAILRNLDRLDDVLPAAVTHVERPFCVQSTAVVTGYLLVVRTNMALGRWMHGIGEIQTMLSKWADAFNTLNGFFAARGGTEEEQRRITNFRVRVAHWFSLLSCLAFATLRHGNEKLDLDLVPIREIFAEDDSRRRVRSFSEMKHEVSWRSEMAKGVMPDLDLYVLSSPTAEEVSLLEMSHDKVNTVSLWIIQGVIIEIRAMTLDVPPPIVSRIFQELSNGMLGFNQAHKVAMVPFPFPFAQLVTLLCTVMYLTLPFFIDRFTQNLVFTPILSFILPMCYCGLNKIAIELEEPFGTDFNDVDIEVRHLEFLHMLIDVLKQPQESPVSADPTTERSILQAIYNVTPSNEKEHLAVEVLKYMVASVPGESPAARVSSISSDSAVSSGSMPPRGADPAFPSTDLEEEPVSVRKRDGRRVSWHDEGAQAI